MLLCNSISVSIFTCAAPCGRVCGVEHSHSEPRNIATNPVPLAPGIWGDKVQDLESPHSDLAHLESFLVVLLYARDLQAAGIGRDGMG